ncbi:hypothetical protein EB001_25475, partial [bacterium]|nr:hypothetical protein [bacterium]
HIKRTKRILHLISLENTAIIETYKTIRNELKQYGQGLDEKEETIILTKTDVTDEKGVATAIKKLEKFNKDILTVTILDDNSIKNLSDEIVKKLRK